MTLLAVFKDYMTSSPENLSFEVSLQDMLKPTCSALETSYNIEIFYKASLDIILCRERITKVLIRLRRCTGWSAPMLFLYDNIRFSPIESHVKRKIVN